ncbi:MAG: LssY C-terminal domain-containing protein [Acidobacteriia bacterium]|nr:LssY C-terminal domain-containing protein [Terriglobia bacterium]
MLIPVKRLLAAGFILAVSSIPTLPIVVNPSAKMEMDIRLASKVASNSSKAGDSIEAVVLAPTRVESKIVIPPGAKLYGKVKEVKSTEGKADQRAYLLLEFNQLEGSGGKKIKLTTKVISVDNARETVDDKGGIVGILASETWASKMDQGLGKMSDKLAALAEILGLAKKAVIKDPDPEITYSPGVEMTLQITNKPDLSSLESASGGYKGEPASPDPELAKLVNAEPFQTMAEKPPKPSDMTNLMFVGSQEQVEAAFTAAGWATAAALDSQSGLETVRAVVENRGYKEAPMSVLLLDGNKPDLTFQKQNNTFAKRHHLRIYHRPSTFDGKGVWVCSATHDIAIEFSPENRTFIHKVDSQIDRERSKVLYDLLLTGKVKSSFLVDRPAVPKESSNATGDKLITDGQMAVLVLD